MNYTKDGIIARGAPNSEARRKDAELVRAFRVINRHLEEKCQCGNNGGGDCEPCITRWYLRDRMEDLGWNPQMVLKP